MGRERVGGKRKEGEKEGRGKGREMENLWSELPSQWFSDLSDHEDHTTSCRHTEARVGPENLHLSPVPGRCCCCWSRTPGPEQGASATCMPFASTLISLLVISFITKMRLMMKMMPTSEVVER